MAIKTTQERLEAVEAAIDKAEAAQAYSVGGRSKQAPQLATLYAERDKLTAQLAREQGTTVGVASFASRGRGCT